MDIAGIKSLMQDVLWEIPDFYRCYEITRYLKTKLASIGVDFEVKDGIVFYDILTFFTEAKRNNCSLYLHGEDVGQCFKAARLVAKIGASKYPSPDALYWRLAIRHSWGILPKEKLLVDCHRRISCADSSSTELFQQFPILTGIKVIDFVKVMRVLKVPQGNWSQVGETVFWAMAEQKGDEIIYPEIDYSTKLRYEEKMNLIRGVV